MERDRTYHPTGGPTLLGERRLPAQARGVAGLSSNIRNVRRESHAASATLTEKAAYQTLSLRPTDSY
jgi:hypothetical protein